MRLRTTLIAVCLLMVAVPAFGASRRHHDDCNSNDADRRIAGCTRIINDRTESEKVRGRAHAARGMAFHVKEDYERALADYDAAIKLDPNDRLALINRGRIRVDSDPERAIDDFDAAIRIDPDDIALYHMRGMLLYSQYMGASAWIRKSDLERAIADFSQMIRLEPASGTGYYLRGQAYTTNGDRDRAAADLIEGIKVDPMHVGIRTLLKQLKPDYEAPKTSLLELLNKP